MVLVVGNKVILYSLSKDEGPVYGVHITQAGILLQTCGATPYGDQTREANLLHFEHFIYHQGVVKEESVPTDYG